jgi:hypothetical protein
MSVSDLIAAIAPAYASDSRIAVFTTLATLQTSRTHLGQNYEYAVALRVCHMIARAPANGPGTPGVVTSAVEGAVSQAYQISPDLMKRYGDLCSSPYGCMLASLIDGNIVGQFAVGGGCGALAMRQGENI